MAEGSRHTRPRRLVRADPKHHRTRYWSERRFTDPVLQPATIGLVVYVTNNSSLRSLAADGRFARGEPVDYWVPM